MCVCRIWLKVNFSKPSKGKDILCKYHLNQSKKETGLKETFWKIIREKKNEGTRAQGFITQPWVQ